MRIETSWNDGDPWMAVSDDGCGMDPEVLRTAMTIAGRGPLADRDNVDLGRFGLGLKTASFSQARQLVVSTRADAAQALERTWDLDLVQASGEWRLLTTAPDTAQPVLDRLWGAMGGATGTIVLWRHLHRLRSVAGVTASAPDTDSSSYYGWLSGLEAHLAMTFHRYLARPGRSRLTLSINDAPVAPWDPFQATFSQTRQIPTERLPVDGQTVAVTGYVLPHRRHLTDAEFEAAGGPRGWMEQEGFYVYRRDRLIVAGGWLGLPGLRAEERFQLARISVEIPVELDHQWSLDVRKATASPPVVLVRPLSRIARHVRREAAEALGRRVRFLSSSNAPERLGSPWLVRSDDGIVRCAIGRDHPLIRRLVADGDAKLVEATLRLLESTVPVTALRVMHEPDRPDPEPFETDDTGETVRSVAGQIYAALLAQGVTAPDARARIARIPWLTGISDYLDT